MIIDLAKRALCIFMPRKDVWKCHGCKCRALQDLTKLGRPCFNETVVPIKTGTYLRWIFLNDYGIKACRQCLLIAQELDFLPIQECINREYELVDKIVQNAKKRRYILARLGRPIIQRKYKEAVELARVHEHRFRDESTLLKLKELVVL